MTSVVIRLRKTFLTPTLWLTVAGILLVLAVAIVVSPVYQRVPSNDSGIALYIGDQILAGNVPYRDVWDVKPPGIYFMDALGLLIAEALWGVWALQFLAIGIASVFGFQVIRRAFGTLPAVVGTAAWLFTLPYLLTGGNLPEEYALPIQFALLYFFLRSVRRGQYGWNLFAIGLLSGMLFVLKYNLIGIAISVVLVIVFAYSRTGNWRGLLGRLGVFTLGSAIVLAAVGVYLQTHGALADFWEATVAYNRGRAGSVMGNPLEWLKPPIIGMGAMAPSGLGILGLAGWIVGVVSLLAPTQLSQSARSLLLVAIVSLPVSFVLTASSGRWTSSYNYMAWLPSLAILSSFLVYMVLSTSGATFRLWRSTYHTPQLVVVTLFLGMAFLPFSKIMADLGNVGEFQSRRQSWWEAAEYVKASTHPDDTVLVWGVGPAINFMAGRQAPTRLAFQHGFLGVGPYFQSAENRQKFEEILADLQLHKPKLIIDTSSTFGVPPLDTSKWQEWVQSHEDGAESIAGRETELRNISEYILANYRLEGTVGKDHFLVYRYDEQ